MMNCFKKALMLALATASLSCWSADGDASRRYQSVYVVKVAVEADMDKNTSEEVQYYVDLERDATTMVQKFFKDEGYALADTPDPANEKQLTIKTKALFNAGNRALRWVGGLFGAGKASANVTMEAVESASGRIISTGQGENSMRMGGFGGSAPGLLMGVIDTAWNGVIANLNQPQ